ncbi:hypothetical protein DPMN_024348 [Dreissena polymorpha]|uniref:Uncharacterized protein n=1 Tax=Dreissena polymorpha TaxID=45954 RepID=A0A9D4RCL8_DREPO|nr:hypothetical protein DPMN_024348 [Dreissena polymorpha]
MCNLQTPFYFIISSSPVVPSGPPTSFLQTTRFWVSPSSCPHVWPICLASASRSRSQVFLGHPLFLFPWGFHVRDCLVVLDAGLRRVWPFHLQRL